MTKMSEGTFNTHRQARTPIAVWAAGAEQGVGTEGALMPLFVLWGAAVAS